MHGLLLLSSDYRVGADGDYKLQANEVAIGLTMPSTAVEILRQRLSPAAFNTAVTMATSFGPDDAAAAGFLDLVVPAADLTATAKSLAASAATLDLNAHAESKRRARAATVAAMRRALDADDAVFAARG